jgi:Ca2+-binding EF-hand superfamily protein
MAAAALSVMGRSAVGSPTRRTSRSPPRARGSGAAKMRASMRRTKLAASTSMSLRSSVSENSTRMAGMSASPNAVSDRLDVQQSFQELFYDKTAEEVKNFSRFNAMALDRDDNADSIEQLKRKMRAASYRDGGQNWDKLFQQYDRDGSGELDLEEFTRAIRRDAGVTRAIFSDDDLDRLFKRIDVDSSGEINAEEFAQFIAWKPSARAAEHAGTDGMSYAEKLQLRNTGVPFVAEYICVRRAVLREGPSLDSPKVGTLEPGEVVAVVRSQGIRLKCVRLRWGDKPSGWASERADGGVGETMLEKLPRGEWSAVEKNDTAIATRVSSLRSAQLIQQQLQEERVRNNEDADAYWSAPLKKFLKEGRLREDAKLPEPPPGWTRTVLATPRGADNAFFCAICI